MEEGGGCLSFLSVHEHKLIHVFVLFLFLTDVCLFLTGDDDDVGLHVLGCRVDSLLDPSYIYIYSVCVCVRARTCVLLRQGFSRSVAFWRGNDSWPTLS